MKKGGIDVNKAKDILLTISGIKEYYSYLKASQYDSPSSIEEYQFKKIRLLLILCFEKIEYYRRLFQEIGFDPKRDFTNLGDLRKIPKLTKTLALKNHSSLLNPSYIKKGLEFRTSGTTGKIFKELVSENHWIVEQGIIWRHWSWFNYRFRDKMAIIRSFVPESGEGLWKDDVLRNFRYYSAYHLNLESVKHYLLNMLEWKPVILRGYPSSLYILAKMSEALNISIQPPKAILTASETLSTEYRTTIERAFNAKVYDWYGQAECTVTFNECEKHEGLHLNSEYGYAELIHGDNMSTDERNIIATNLNNYAMPLIRYETGDIAIVLEDGACSCGRNLPLIKSIKGRHDDFLYTPDDRVIPSVNLYTFMDSFEEIIEFQFIQNKIDLLTVNISSLNKNIVTNSRLIAGLRNRFGTDISFDINHTSDFIKTEEGKKRVIVSLLSESARLLK